MTLEFIMALLIGVFACGVIVVGVPLLLVTSEKVNITRWLALLVFTVLALLLLFTIKRGGG